MNAIERDTASLTAVRLRLKEPGYDPIPLKTGKKPYPGWPREPNSPADIAVWSRYAGCVATGIRLFQSPNLLVLDLDIRIAAVRDAILEAWTQRWPQFMANCVRRHSQGVPLALIGRSKANKGTLKSRRWRTEGAEQDNLVEVFTRHSKRYLVVDGAHSSGRAYGYQGPPLWEIAPDKLPEFPFGEIAAALTIADDIMRAAGLAQKQAAILGKYIVYDLTAQMRIVLEDGEELTLAELERQLKAGPARRTVAFPTPWDPESKTARVLATIGREGLCLWDTKTETSHRWAWRKPPESFAALAAQLRALKGEHNGHA